MAMHVRRADFWRRNEACTRARRMHGYGSYHALECTKAPDIEIGPCRRMNVNLRVWGPNAIDVEVRMVIDAIEHVDADPHQDPPLAPRVYLRRSTCFNLPSGATRGET